MTSSFFLKSANLPLCAITRVTRDTVISHSLMACSLMNGRVLCKGTEILLNLTDHCKILSFMSNV